MTGFRHFACVIVLMTGVTVMMAAVEIRRHSHTSEGLRKISVSICSRAYGMRNEAYVTLSSADGIRTTADRMRNSVLN